ncbi:hypothetical protein BX600DRAFT_96144 [Xylariales sp. PMI_506]|nr:hypothetical protein BX600DRAFT_96144 [Xylariales sp. PMI_506]
MGLRAAIRLVLDRARGLEDRINASTFGRVFHLDGSGHVCCLYSFPVSLTSKFSLQATSSSLDVGGDDC